MRLVKGPAAKATTTEELIVMSKYNKLMMYFIIALLGNIALLMGNIMVSYRFEKLAVFTNNLVKEHNVNVAELNKLHAVNQTLSATLVAVRADNAVLKDKVDKALVPESTLQEAFVQRLVRPTQDAFAASVDFSKTAFSSFAAYVKN